MTNDNRGFTRGDGSSDSSPSESQQKPSILDQIVDTLADEDDEENENLQTAITGESGDGTDAEESKAHE